MNIQRGFLDDAPVPSPTYGWTPEDTRRDRFQLAHRTRNANEALRLQIRSKKLEDNPLGELFRTIHLADKKNSELRPFFQSADSGIGRLARRYVEDNPEGYLYEIIDQSMTYRL